jgi:hypothetical protein
MFAHLAPTRALSAPRSTRVYSVACGGKSVAEKPEGGPSDEALLRRVAEGEIAAFQAFYQRYSGRVLSYARQLSHNHRDFAEDVVQEVFVAVWRRAASYSPERGEDRKSTRLNSSHNPASRMPSSA